jgi:hypothetical protein
MGPSVCERRLTLRILERWRDACGDRLFPRLTDIQADSFGDDWHNCLIIAPAAPADRRSFEHVGLRLRSDGDVRANRISVPQLAANTILRQVTAQADRVLDKRVPISVGGSAVHLGGVVLFRSILLPLSEDGGCITALLGAANYKQIAQTEDEHRP